MGSISVVTWEWWSSDEKSRHHLVSYIEIIALHTVFGRLVVETAVGFGQKDLSREVWPKGLFNFHLMQFLTWFMSLLQTDWFWYISIYSMTLGIPFFYTSLVNMYRLGNRVKIFAGNQGFK